MTIEETSLESPGWTRDPRASRAPSAGAPSAARVSLLALVACTAAACGGAPAVSVEPVALRPGADRWARLDFVERHGVMTFRVLPTLSRRFHRFSGSADPELACVTCHGQDAEAVSYRRPNGLPVLDASRAASDEPMVRFMRDEVMPAADNAMEAGGTLTCFSCHPRAEPR